MALANRPDHARATGLENDLVSAVHFEFTSHEVMTQHATTIWEAARDRFAEWALSARSQDGSRSLPGSPRYTDQDIWSATHSVATDKSRCGTALTVTARLGREDVSKTDRCECVRDLQEVWAAHPHLLDLRFFAWLPKGGDAGFNRSHAKSGNPMAALRAAVKGTN